MSSTKTAPSKATSQALFDTPIVLDGRIVLAGSTDYSARQIAVNGSTVIITNGFPLSLRCERLVFSGQPKILAYEPRAGRPSGDNGRDAGAITFKVGEVSGSNIQINNAGEDGVNGAAGAKGPAGSHGAQGQQQGWDPIAGCHGGTNGGSGGLGGPGARGQAGGRGGRGGDIILAVISGLGSGAGRRIVVNSTAGGRGGQGGVGGPGGDGGAGGQGAPGTAFCGGTNGGPNGPVGPAGPAGGAGASGPDGRIYTV